MYKITGIASLLTALALPVANRPPAASITLRVESITGRPVTFTVWTRLGDRRDSVLVADSVTKTTPVSIPLDSATREIRLVTKANAPVRVRVLDGSRELQRPANAWGRDLRLVRDGDLFQVVFDARLLRPR